MEVNNTGAPSKPGGAVGGNDRSATESNHLNKERLFTGKRLVVKERINKPPLLEAERVV